MKTQFKINGTRFECVADPDALGEDILGDCEFRFSPELAPVVWHEANDFRSFDGTLAESQENRTGEEWEDGEPLRLEADGGILALCVLAELGEPWRFEWDGSGSAFWLFHDVTHALEDWTVWEDGGAWNAELTDGVLAWNEDRANLKGARRAIRAGVDVGDVLGELAGSLPRSLRRRLDRARRLAGVRRTRRRHGRFLGFPKGFKSCAPIVWV